MAGKFHRKKVGAGVNWHGLFPRENSRGFSPLYISDPESTCAQIHGALAHPNFRGGHVNN